MPDRQMRIEQRLREAFSPTTLAVLDESHRHRGHPGAQGGGGHYRITLQADCFKNKSRLECHRQIYTALADMLAKEIHAISIHIQ